MPASACAARTTAGRSRSGRRTCSTRTTGRSRSIRRCRAAARTRGGRRLLLADPRATQLYGAFLGEPRTFGVTLRGRTRLRIAAQPPPPSPPPPRRRPDCADGTSADRRLPPPPPPPPAASRSAASAAKLRLSTKGLAGNGGAFSFRLLGFDGSRRASSAERSARYRADRASARRRGSDRRRLPRARRRSRYARNGCWWPSPWIARGQAGEQRRAGRAR